MLNIGSINAYSGEANLLAYSISKGALMTLSRNLADALVLRPDPRQPFQRRLGAHAERVQAEDRRRPAARLAGASRAAVRAVGPDPAARGDRRGGRLLAVSDESRPISGSVLELEQYPIIGRNPDEARRLMPQLAAFPKAYMDELCVDGTMTIREWIELAATLDIDGLEFYTGFLELREPAAWRRPRGRWRPTMGWRSRCSAARPISRIRTRRFAGSRSSSRSSGSTCAPSSAGSYCRVLSGQRRPEVSRDDGLALRRRVASRPACRTRPSAASRSILENHYKDNYWQYPEFAQQMDVFLRPGRSHRLAAFRRQLRSEQRDPGRRRSAGAAAAREAPRRHDARQRSLPGRRHARRPAPRGRQRRLRAAACGTASSAAA